MMSWRIELFIIQGRGATRSKIFPRNEIAIVPGELFIIEVFLTISLGFLQSLPSPGIHDTCYLYHSFGT